MPIHQEQIFKAKPHQVFTAILNGDEFSAATGAPAQIVSQPGGEFTCFGGMITGRLIEVVEDQRIVQAWRVGNWEPGVYSIAHFELTPHDSGTKLVFTHTGYPAEHEAHLDKGWDENYWSKLKKYFS